MKKCYYCREWKELEEFYWQNKALLKRTDICKLCKNDYDNSRLAGVPYTPKYHTKQAATLAPILRPWVMGRLERFLEEKLGKEQVQHLLEEE